MSNKLVTKVFVQKKGEKSYDSYKYVFKFQWFQVARKVLLWHVYCTLHADIYFIYLVNLVTPNDILYEHNFFVLIITKHYYLLRIVYYH